MLINLKMILEDLGTVPRLNSIIVYENILSYVLSFDKHLSGHPGPDICESATETCPHQNIYRGFADVEFQKYK